jgi:hypothetical protein
MIRRRTHAESKSIKQSQEVACFVHQDMTLRPKECDFEAQEGAMEFCWHFIRKEIRKLRAMTEPLYGPRRSLTLEQTAVRLMANQIITVHRTDYGGDQLEGYR